MTDQCQFCVFGPKMLDKCEYYHLPESIANYENGNRRIPTEVMEKACEILGVTQGEIDKGAEE